MKAWHGILFFFLALPAPGRAQAPGVPVEEPEEWEGNKEILARAGALREAGKLVPSARLLALLDRPVPEVVPLPPARTVPLSRPDIYELARRSRVRIGWYYQCADCGDWHTNLAGGYPLTADGVIATCHHVVLPEDGMKEGYLIVVDAAGRVSPVTSVIARSEAMDSCIVRTGGTFEAMPLTDQVRPGDAAYCLSDPLGFNGYFSEGMVNRFYRMPEGEGPPEENLRLNVSTDWAPGSSGSPVLDQCGNVIGHVSTITALTEEEEAEGPKPREPAAPHANPDKEGEGGKAAAAEEKPEAPPAPGTQIILHEACPSRLVVRLVQQAAAACTPPRPDKP